MYGGNGDDTLTGGSGNECYGGTATTPSRRHGKRTYLFPWSPGMTR